MIFVIAKNGLLLLSTDPSVVCVFTGLARVHGFTFGDSLDESKKNKWREFGSRLTKVSIFIEFLLVITFAVFGLYSERCFSPYLAAPKLRRAMDFDS